MAKIDWTLRSLDRIESSAEFIAQKSPQNADNFVVGVLERVEQMVNQPRSGRIVPEFQIDWLREVFFQNHRIVYSIKNPKIIRVLTVFSSRMKFPVGDVETEK